MCSYVLYPPRLRDRAAITEHASRLPLVPLSELREVDYDQKCAMAAYIVCIPGLSFEPHRSLHVWLWLGDYDDRTWLALACTARRFSALQFVWCHDHGCRVLHARRIDNNPTGYGGWDRVWDENILCPPCHARRSRAACPPDSQPDLRHLAFVQRGFRF